MALSRVFSEILNVEKCRDHEIRVRGHSNSLKVVPFDRLGKVFYSNFVPSGSLEMYTFIRYSA